MVLKVCVGSACHVKGSYDVIEVIKKVLAKEHLEDKVELKACFCLGHCTEGVSVSFEGREGITNFSNDNIEEPFRKLLQEVGL